MHRTRVLVPLVLLAAAACARGAAPTSVGTDSQSPTSSSTAEATAKQKVQRVDPRKGGFELGFGEFAITMEAKAIRPGPVTFVIRNGGKLTHGLEIKSEGDGGSNSGPGGGGDDEFEIESATFGPGRTIRVQANLPPGIYEIECFVAEHDDLGMRAFLEVRQDAPLVKPKAAGDDEVLIEGFAFNPGTIEVVGGTRVVWTNTDPEQHTVTAEDGVFESDALGPDGTFAFTFEAPGEFAYLCAIHPAMKGTVRVTG
jgi:plastocyanin